MGINHIKHISHSNYKVYLSDYTVHTVSDSYAAEFCEENNIDLEYFVRKIKECCND